MASTARAGPSPRLEAGASHGVGARGGEPFSVALPGHRQAVIKDADTAGSGFTGDAPLLVPIPFAKGALC